MKENMPSPFDVSQHPDGILINIATGLLASSDVQASLLGIAKKGDHLLKNFVDHTLSGNGNSDRQSFYKPITKNKLLTFDSMLQKTKLIQGDKIVTVIISPEVVFRRALTLSETRPGVSMTEVLKHPFRYFMKMDQ